MLLLLNLDTATMRKFARIQLKEAEIMPVYIRSLLLLNGLGNVFCGVIVVVVRFIQDAVVE